MNNTTKTFNQTTPLVFIDAGVDNYQQLFDGVVANAKAFILDTATDGIEQISQILQQYPEQKTVHIISHGSPGCLYLGNSQLSLDTLKQYAPQLQQWNIDNLLLYGCHVAAGDAGEEFVGKLRGLTGADIAASKSLTGNAVKGGNWELEVKVGAGEFAAAFSAEVMATYAGVLGTVAEVEPNNSIAEAQVINPASFSTTFNPGIQTFDGTNISTTVPHVTIPGTGDGTVDFYQISVAAGQRVIFDIDDASFDSHLTLYNSLGNQLRRNDDRAETGNTGGNFMSFLDYTFPDAGNYIIEVERLGFVQIIPGGTYTLHISLGVPPDNTAPTITSSTSASVAENTTAVMTVTATDADSDPITYSITGGEDQALFGIDSVTGAVTFNTAPDFEAPADSGGDNNYQIEVTANDGMADSIPQAITISVADVDETPTMEGTPGSDIFRGTNTAENYQALGSHDRVYGNGGADNLDGGDGNDIIYGGNDDDFLDGGVGHDRLNGDNGNDELFGNDGNDILNGGAGNDILNGGTGSDRYNGGAGADTFIIGPGMGIDLIQGFEDGTDIIELEGIGFDDLDIVKSGSSTLIKVAATGEALATLSGINVGLVGADDFSGGVIPPGDDHMMPGYDDIAP